MVKDFVSSPFKENRRSQSKSPSKRKMLSPSKKVTASPIKRVPFSPLSLNGSFDTTTVTLLDDSSTDYEYIATNNVKRDNDNDDGRFEVKVLVDINDGFSTCVNDWESSDSSSSSSINDDDDDGCCCFKKLKSFRSNIDNFFIKNRDLLSKIILAICLLAYSAFFITACVLNIHRAMALVVITSLVVTWFIYAFIRDMIGYKVYQHCWLPLVTSIKAKWFIIQWFIYVGLLVAIVTYIAFEIRPKPQQLISLAGLAMFLLFLFVFSKHPSKVHLRPVLWGLGIQFIFGVIILRTSFGYAAFKFLGEEAHKFLNYTDYGSAFVFGHDTYEHHFFAFKVLPVVVFFSCVISTLYYLGAMQGIICKIAWVMQVTMGTSATESLCAAGNIFVGQTEAPILVHPFLLDMTKSEIHAMMTGGFATIAGGVLAAYILFGVPAEHLLSASVMNAPIALAVSKLFYPETEESRFKNSDEIPIEKGKERNLLEAASAGASSSISLVANIAANLIAFLAMLAFVNATLSWFGSLVDLPELTFQLLCSYLFMPVAFMMGVEWNDANKVGEMLGIKLFLNEFVAYKELSGYIANRKSCDPSLPQLSVRSEIIATYALCGFANLSSIGIQLGGIGSMIPERKGDLAKMAVRALTAGFISCLITACVAGILIVEDSPYICNNGTAIINSTTETMVTTFIGTTL